MESILLVSSVFLWLMVLLNLLLTLALISRINATSTRSQKLPDSLNTGDAAPAFAAHTLAGDPVTLADYSGRATVLIFVAPGCKACHELISTLHTLEPYAHRAGVALVLVSGDALENTRMMAQTMNIRLPLLAAPQQTNPFFHDYKIHGTPSYCSINELGTVQSAGHSQQGFAEWKALTDSWVNPKSALRKEVVISND